MSTDLDDSSVLEDQPHPSTDEADSPEPPARPHSRIRRPAFGIVGFLLLLVLVGGVLLFFGYLKQSGHASLEIGAEPDEYPDRFDIQVDRNVINTTDNELTVRIVVRPRGDLESSSRADAAAVPFRLFTSGVGQEVIQFEAGEPITAITANLAFFGGQYVDYPIDSHETVLKLSAVELGEDGDPGPAIPVRVVMTMESSLWDIGIDAVADAPDDVAMDLDASRSAVTISWVAVMIIVYWSVAIAMLAITWLALIGRRLFLIDYVYFGVTLMFAFAAFRGTAPGDPPFGSIFDFVSFFPAEIIVAACTVALIAYHLHRREHAGATPG